MEERNNKISKANLGKKQSKEHRAKCLKNLEKANAAIRKDRDSCSRKIARANGGKRSHLWRGGITALNLRIRNRYRYRQWRKAVFERDDYTCQGCGKRGGYLHADHIKSFSKIIKENDITTYGEALKCKELWDIENGRTLCVGCRKKTDSYLNRWQEKEIKKLN